MTAVAAVPSASPTVETISRELETGLPPAPAFMALARFTYDPGALFGPAQGAGPVVFRVLRGKLDFEADLPVYLRHGGPTKPRATMTPGEWFQVVEGDQLLVPGEVPHSAKSMGPEQALTMGVAIFGEAPALQFPPGIGFQPLVFGAAMSFPPAPVEVSLQRVTMAEGAAPHRAEGPELYYIESGEVTVSVDAGDVHASQAPGAPPMDAVAPGGTRTLTANNGLSAQAGASLSLAGAGATVYVVAVRDSRAAGREAKEVVRRYFYDVWSDGNVDLVDELFAPDFVNNNPLDGQSPDRGGVRQFVHAVLSAFPDCSVGVDLQVAETRRVVTRYTFRGTHRGSFMGLEPTDRPVEITGITIFRLEDLRIAESWGYWELATLLAQVGEAPWASGVFGEQLGFDRG